MATGSPFLPRMHLPSHWFSCGQTRPQTEGSRLSPLMAFSAPAQSSSRIFSMNCGMWTPTGQPSMHRGFLQSRQRLASATASWMV